MNPPTDPRAAIAALNNAEWCDAVARAHGAASRFEPGFWINPGSAPPFYPNIVTLDPAAAGRQMEAIRAFAAGRRDGFGVKDSFAALDLASLGLGAAFAADWLWLDPAQALAEAETSAVTTVTSAAELRGWETAWRGGAGETIFPAALLADPRLAFLALWRGERIAAGAALNRSPGALGLSNLFHDAGDRSALRALFAAARRQAPGLPLVGYEEGDSLAAFLAEGFESIGRLRVFIRD